LFVRPSSLTVTNDCNAQKSFRICTPCRTSVVPSVPVGVAAKAGNLAGEIVQIDHDLISAVEQDRDLVTQQAQIPKTVHLTDE